MQTQDLPELRHARGLWKENRLLEALAMFQNVAKSHPNNALALTDVSRALGSFYRIQEAERVLDRLVELAEGHGPMLQLAGQSYRLIHRPEKAIHCFESALRADDQLADAHLELALLLERCHRLDQAIEHVSARLRLLPDDAEATMLKGRLHRRMGEAGQSETVLRSVCQATGVFWMTRARAWAELSVLLDSQCGYDEAWSAMLAGKQVAIPQSRAARAHRDKLVPPLNKLVAEMRAATAAEWYQRSAPDIPPIVLLTGLPRSGTTLLEVLLDEHSQIVGCDEFDAFPKLVFPAMLGKTRVSRLDVNFLADLPENRLDKLSEMYVRSMCEAHHDAVNGHWILDKNPSLLLLIPAYLRLFPGFQLLVALRDPRDLLVSCMMTYFPLNDFSVDFLNLSTAAARIASDLNVWLQLRQVLPANWVEVRYESLCSETRQTQEAALKQLGLKPEAENTIRTSSSPLNSPSYEQVAQPIYGDSIGRWKNYLRHLAPALGALDEVADALNYAY